jgi:hypothetical protein
MQIAFRKTNAPGFFPGLFNAYTKWSLKTDYSHGGVVIGDQLWHTTKHGVRSETFESTESWDLFETDVSDKIALDRCTKVLGMRYDTASLLGFKLPIRVTDSRGLYCFELQWLAYTGEHPKKKVSPDTVMAELLRNLNAQARPTCGAFNQYSCCNRGVSDSPCAKPCRVAAKSDLSNFGLSDIHRSLSGNMGNQR